MPRDDDLFVDPDKIDCGPWYITPESSRVSRFRYDYGNKMIQVQWTNEDEPWSNQGYLYEASGRDFQVLRERSSKGKTINNPMNGRPYRPMTPTEYSAPVTRSDIATSRLRNVSEIRLGNERFNLKKDMVRED